MSNLTIKKKNEVYITIHSDEEHVHRELSDYFTFEVPEAKFLKKNPRYKYWDGTIRLYSPATGSLYHGLVNRLHTWADERQYHIEYEKDEWYGEVYEENDFVSPRGVKVFMDFFHGRRFQMFASSNSSLFSVRVVRQQAF